MNDLMKLLAYCDTDITKLVAHVLDVYESGRGCVLCEHTAYCKQRRCAALCARGVAEYIRRMEDGAPEPEPRGGIALDDITYRAIDDGRICHYCPLNYRDRDDDDKTRYCTPDACAEALREYRTRMDDDCEECRLSGLLTED